MPVRTQPQQAQLSASYTIKSSTIETIDYALYNFINDELNIYVTSNKGFEKVPIIFSIPERAHQVKNLRTTNEKPRKICNDNSGIYLLILCNVLVILRDRYKYKIGFI